MMKSAKTLFFGLMLAGSLLFANQKLLANVLEKTFDAPNNLTRLSQLDAKMRYFLGRIGRRGELRKMG
jgi:hypothetical protein